jgi:hypothetical protein
MRGRLALAIVALLLAAGCGGEAPHSNSTGIPADAAGKQILNTVQMSPEQRLERHRRALPAGTKIYRIEVASFSAGNSLYEIPTAHIIAVHGSTVTYTTADGAQHVLTDARMTGVAHSQEVYVLPGQSVPRYLAHRDADEVVR